jgi:hypothetical protein
MKDATGVVGGSSLALRVVMADGIFGRIFNRGQQNQSQQEGCGRLDGKCGTAQMQPTEIRQEVSNRAQPVALPGPQSQPSSAQVQSASYSPAANPRDTSNAKPISNGLHAQTNKDGSLTVTIPLTNNDVVVGTQARYAFKTPTESTPGPQPLGNLKSLVAHGSTSSPLVAHKVYNSTTQQWELQVTVKDASTTGEVWIGNQSHKVDPGKIKAELARTRLPAASPSDFRLVTPAVTPAPTPAAAPKVVSTVTPSPTPASGPATTPSTSPVTSPELRPKLPVPSLGPTGRPGTVGLGGETNRESLTGAEIKAETPVVVGLPKAPAQDSELQKMREQLEVAISQLAGTDVPSTAATLKEVLKTTLETVDKTEKKLREIREKLATSWEDKNISVEQRRESVENVKKIDEALKGGLVTALKELGAQKPDNLSKFSPDAFFKKFESLLALTPPVAVPTPAPAPTAGAGTAKTEPSAGAAVPLERERSKQLADVLKEAKQQLNLLKDTVDTRVSTGREHLERIIIDADTIEQRLIEERKLLVATRSSAEAETLQDIDKRIGTIDKLIDNDLPKYLKRSLYKQNGSLKDLATLDRIDPMTKFSTALSKLESEVPSINGAKVEIEKPGEIKVLVRQYRSGIQTETLSQEFNEA